mmetsp:Transcript_5161/g.8496  ORF Transcript_5161/g.8496 Transcript_5161/m.8496 type:complete len:186 (+) Transcript_5161:534-1091(+)
MTFQAGLLLLQLWWQWQSGRWVFTLSNLNSAAPTGRFDYGRLIEIFIVSPIREELVFRGVIMHILYNRYPSGLVAALWSGVFFGLVHLINIANSKFSRLYIIAQVFLGWQIGFFYALRSYRSGSLWEAIIFHMCNNLAAIFAPFDLDISDPFIKFSVYQAAAFYGIMILYECACLRKERALQKQA